MEDASTDSLIGMLARTVGTDMKHRMSVWEWLLMILVVFWCGGICLVVLLVRLFMGGG